MDRLTYSPSEAAEVLGVSRPTIYTLIKRDDFPVFKAGTRTLISVEGLRKWVQTQAEDHETHEKGATSCTI